MIELGELKRELQVKVNQHAQKVGEKTSLETYKRELEQSITESTELNVVLDKVTLLLNSIGETKQQQAQAKIEGIVTKGLQAVFGNDYSFHVNQITKGKNSTIEFTVKTKMGDAVVETPVLEAHGGGLAQIIGFLLRTVIIMLTPDKNQSRVMILDETFGMVSESLIEPLAGFMKELIDKAGFQFLLITHSPSWVDYADTVYRFSNKNGQTYAKEEA